jgi:hypothetical protein
VSGYNDYGLETDTGEIAPGWFPVDVETGTVWLNDDCGIGFEHVLKCRKPNGGYLQTIVEPAMVFIGWMTMEKIKEDYLPSLTSIKMFKVLPAGKHVGYSVNAKWSAKKFLAGTGLAGESEEKSEKNSSNIYDKYDGVTVRDYVERGWFPVDVENAAVWLNKDFNIPFEAVLSCKSSIASFVQISANPPAVYVGNYTMKVVQEKYPSLKSTTTVTSGGNVKEYKINWGWKPEMFDSDVKSDNDLPVAQTSGWVPMDSNYKVWYNHGFAVDFDLYRKSLLTGVHVTNDHKFVYFPPSFSGNAGLWKQCNALALDVNTFTSSKYSKIHPHLTFEKKTDTVLSMETTTKTTVKSGAAEKGYRCVQCGHKGITGQCECCVTKVHCVGCGQPIENCYCCASCGCYPCECDTNVAKSAVDSDCACALCQDLAKKPAPKNLTATYTSKKNRSGHGQSDDAPWEKRGVSIVGKTSSVSWKKIWNIDDQIDLCTAAADFYLLEPLAAGIINLPDNKIHGWQYSQLRRDWPRVAWSEDQGRTDDVYMRHMELSFMAQRMLDSLSTKLAATFSEYCHMAIGGELRHHRAVGDIVLARSERMSAWVGWKKVVDAIGGEQAMRDAQELFSEAGWGGSYGGRKWAMACDIMALYLSGKINSRIFVDRCFNLQHNCGALLNKISWKHTNSQGWSVEDLQTKVLPAHGQKPEPDWKTLAKVASPIVIRMFEQMWDLTNEYRANPGHADCCGQIWPERENKFTKITYRLSCSYCGSDPKIGHNQGCGCVYMSDVANIDLMTSMGYYNKIEEGGILPTEYYYKADGTVNVDMKIDFSLSCMKCGLNGKTGVATLNDLLTDNLEIVPASNNCGHFTASDISYYGPPCVHVYNESKIKIASIRTTFKNKKIECVSYASMLQDMKNKAHGNYLLCDQLAGLLATIKSKEKVTLSKKLATVS